MSTIYYIYIHIYIYIYNMYIYISYIRYVVQFFLAWSVSCLYILVHLVL